MKSLTDVFARSVVDVLMNQEQSDARASIRSALTTDSRLAVRTIQAIVESGKLTATATPSPESFADLLLEFIDPVVINALIATPYAPTDTAPIAAMACLLSSVTEHKRLLIAKAACTASSGSPVATRVLQTIELSPEPLDHLVQFAIFTGFTDPGPFETIVSRYPRILTAPQLAVSIVEALSAQPQQGPQQGPVLAMARAIADRTRLDDEGDSENSAVCTVSLVASKVAEPRSSHAALRILESIVSVAPALAELTIAHIAASQPFDEHSFASLARCLFDPNSSSSAAMTACITTALAQHDQGLASLGLLADTNRALFCRCVAGAPLARIITEGGDLDALFGTLASIRPDLLSDVLTEVPRVTTAVSAIRQKNTPALVSLIQHRCVVHDGPVSPAVQATLFAAMKRNSPFKAPCAIEPEVFASLLSLVAALRREPMHASQVASDLSILRPLIHCAEAAGAAGADRREADRREADRREEGECSEPKQAMIRWITQALECTVYDLIKSGEVFAEARDAGSHALLGTLVRLLAAERATVKAVTNNEVFAELIAPNTPTWLIRLMHDLSTAEAQARIGAAHPVLRHLTLAHDACFGDTQHRALTQPVVAAIESAESEVTQLIESLEGIWTLRARVFASAMDLASPIAEQQAHLRALERILRLGDNPRLAVERVYTSPLEHCFFATAFDCPWITELIIDSNNHPRLDLLRAFGLRARSARPSVPDTLLLRRFVHIDRSVLDSPARALAAVHLLAHTIEARGGYGLFGLDAFCGILSVTLSDSRSECIMLDSATGSGAQRDVALFLLRLCQATGALFSAHPAGPAPKHDADQTVMYFYGFIIALAIFEGLTLGPACLAPSVLACITGTPINLARAFFGAYSNTQLDSISVDLMLSTLSPLTDGFTAEDAASLTPPTGSVCHATLLPFLDSVDARGRMHHNLGGSLEALAAGFAAAIGDSTLLGALRAILTDPPPIALAAACPSSPSSPSSPSGPSGPTKAPTTTTELVASLLIGPTRIDPVALQRNTLYEDPFNEASPVVSWFWRIVHALSQADLRTLLRFWTSGTPPPGGVHPAKYLILPVHKMQIPTARTCLYTLYLWDAYISISELEGHIRTALANTDSGMEG